jgi:hypothetical protein
MEEESTATHVDVRMKDRHLTLHNNVPIGYVRPLHPVGIGERVIVIQGESVGSIYSVKKTLEGGVCLLSGPGSTNIDFSCGHIDLSLIPMK